MAAADPRAGHAVALGLGTRARIRVRRGYELGRDLARFSSEHGMWWLLPLTVVLLIVALAITTANAALPYVVYTLV